MCAICSQIKVIEQDILTVTSGIICHQVNCRGRMGSGIALAIAQKWPKVEREYKAHCDNTNKLSSMLGDYQLVQVQHDNYGGLGPRQDAIFVCNIFGQDGYGREKQHTDYVAVNQAFTDFAWDHVNDKDDYLFLSTVYIPWKMGCDRGGGDWDTYRRIIESHIPYVTYCKLPG